MRTYTMLLVLLAAFSTFSVNAQVTYNLRTNAPAGEGLIQALSTWEATTGSMPTFINSSVNNDRYNLEVRTGETVIVEGFQQINGNILVRAGGILRFRGPQANPGRMIMDVASSIFVEEGATITSDAPGNAEVAQRLRIGEQVIDGSEINILNNCPKPFSLNEVTLGIYNETNECLGSVPLPVQIRSFTAKTETSGVRVEWVAEKEWDFSHYELERSTDGKNFSKIYEVKGANSEISGAVTYEYLDARPQKGTNYYRLKAVDTDGTNNYEGLVQASFYAGDAFYYSNSSARSLKLWAAKSNTLLDARLIDLQGHVLWKGALAEETEIRDIQPGLYVLQVASSSGENNVQKILIQ